MGSKKGKWKLITDTFLKLLERLGRKRIIMDRVSDEPYLERYYLFLKERERFPFNVFLHKFLKGDPDDLHDHPWPYATLILKGGYWETTPKGRFWRGPGHFRFASADSYHRIELEPGVICWTLFMPGPHRKEWGFDVEGKWVKWDDYLRMRYEKISTGQ
jgi:hypothetical protein